MLIAILTAIVAINILVLAHELGHFIVAKRRGICVGIFSIGFGPKLLWFRWKGTEYRLCLILFGGYVKFKGDELEESNRNIPGGFYSVSPFSRILVCFAGGFFNIILALILYTVIFFLGKPVLEDSLNTVIGWVKPGSVAEKIGLIPGDKILNINNKPVKTWMDLLELIALSGKDKLILEVERDGNIITKIAVLKPDPKTGIGKLGVGAKRSIQISKIKKDSPAQKAGLLEGDRIIAVNGMKIYRLKPLVKTVRQNLGRSIKLIILRNKEEISIQVIPQRFEDKKYGYIGISEFTMPWTTIYPKPWEQFWDDLLRTWRTLKALITRHIPVRALSGPVGIIGIIGLSIQVGLVPLLSIIALISLNLGIVNLLPIPVLDGGHIMFNVFEAIRKKPLNIKTIEKIQNVFMALLILLALYVTYNDILRVSRWFIR